MSIDQTPDPEAFRDFEHAGWTSNVSEYEAAFARITSQAIGPLLDAVDLRPGARMLDVATGPGYVAAAAAERGARAVGVDFSAPMVARARTIYPTVEFQEGDAEAISFLPMTDRPGSPRARYPFDRPGAGPGGGRGLWNHPQGYSISW